MTSHASVKRPSPAAAASLAEENADEFVRKKVKLSELPMSAAARQDIDRILHNFKKKGEFDKLRKQIYADFIASDANDTLKTSLEKLTDAEVERDPHLLAKNRQMATALVGGAAERSEIYKVAGQAIDEILEKYLNLAETSIRDIRIGQVGRDQSEKEHLAGSKSEEDYAHEAAQRKAERTLLRQQLHETARQKEREAKRKADDEKKRRREEEDAREREREAVDAQRRKQREAEYEQKRREEEEADSRRRSRHYDDHRDRRDRDVRSSKPERRRDRDGHSSAREKEPAPKMEIKSEKDLEEAALQEILKESLLAAKSRQRPEFERDQTLEPPPRRLQPKKLILSRHTIAAKPLKLDQPNAVPKTEHSLHQESRQHSRSARAREGEARNDYEGLDQRSSKSHEQDRRAVMDSDERHSVRERDKPRDRDGRRHDDSRTRKEDPSRRLDGHRLEGRRRSKSPSPHCRPPLHDSKSPGRGVKPPRDCRSTSRRRRSKNRSPAAVDRYLQSTSARSRDARRTEKEPERTHSRERVRQRDDQENERCKPELVDRYMPAKPKQAGGESRARDRDRVPSPDDERSRKLRGGNHRHARDDNGYRARGQSRSRLRDWSAEGRLRDKGRDRGRERERHRDRSGSRHRRD